MGNLGLDTSEICLKNTNTIYNLSTCFVTEFEKKVLSKGLDFAIFPQYLNILDQGGQPVKDQEPYFLFCYRKKPYYSHGHTRCSCCSLKKGLRLE